MTDLAELWEGVVVEPVCPAEGCASIVRLDAQVEALTKSVDRLVDSVHALRRELLGNGTGTGGLMGRVAALESGEREHVAQIAAEAAIAAAQRHASGDQAVARVTGHATIRAAMWAGVGAAMAALVTLLVALLR